MCGGASVTEPHGMSSSPLQRCNKSQPTLWASHSWFGPQVAMKPFTRWVTRGPQRRTEHLRVCSHLIRRAPGPWEVGEEGQ